MILRLATPATFSRPVMNPSPRAWIIGGTLVAIGVGIGVFFYTRKAAAAAAGTEAFEVSADCMLIRVRDEAAAKRAVIAAAIVVHPSPGDLALDAIRQILAVVLPQCDWIDIPSDRKIISGSAMMTWAQMQSMVGSSTVAELRNYAGELEMASAPLPPPIQWMFM